MTIPIKFTKMQGAGNDYIYVDTHQTPIHHPEEVAILWSTPHTGIGSDGLVLIGSSQVADFSMRIFNADGSEAVMCGNASRCVGKYLYERGLTKQTNISLETLSGIKQLCLHLDNETVESVTVDMGIPTVLTTLSEQPCTAPSLGISMGNPHWVTFVDQLADITLEEVGPTLEHHPRFPGGINVEFAQVMDAQTIRMRVWERGSGITKACGTGACATVVAAVLMRRTNRRVDVIMDGGTLGIEWDKRTGHVLMTGPAVIVFDGIIHLKR